MLEEDDELREVVPDRPPTDETALGEGLVSDLTGAGLGMAGAAGWDGVKAIGREGLSRFQTWHDSRNEPPLPPGGGQGADSASETGDFIDFTDLGC
jgi:hypothetical protein